MKTIVYGVCGIGNGHTFRQLPTLRALADSNKIMVFAYGDSLATLSKHFAEHANVRIAEVAVPFYVGAQDGIDYDETARLAELSGLDYLEINTKAFADAKIWVGKPDLVISDYEPVAAHYAYVHGAPLITIDQQSKYLIGEFPPKINGQTVVDEVERLQLFFPKATARLACSFFEVQDTSPSASVDIVPPVLRPELERIKSSARARDPQQILVYLSAQEGLEQSSSELMAVFATASDYQFEVFLPYSMRDKLESYENVNIHPHGDSIFDDVLSTCSGIISTAGHGLLSEAMYLDLPVLALPLPIYEQQMNALIVQQNHFGLSTETLEETVLREFLNSLITFASNIKSDLDVLVRGNGAQSIIDRVNALI